MDPIVASVNALAEPLIRALLADSESLRLRVERDDDGVCYVDAGIASRGGIEAGRRIAEICMGGLGRVRVDNSGGDWPVAIEVASSQPVLACLASQYAGWSLSHGEGKEGWFALASGPARAIAGREKLFEELGYRDQHASAALVLEVDCRPPQPVIAKVLRDTGLQPEGLTVILTPTKSLAGTTQVVARVLEVALHKVHALGFDPRIVVDGNGRAPLPAPVRNFLTAMARTNDAILYGGVVHLIVDCDDHAAQDLCSRLPSCCSRDYGRSFGDLFKDAGYDFYKLDPMLFAPARVLVSNLASGKTFSAGATNDALLRELWLTEKDAA
jgi:methenyltetrahydromethanopterin cyclohydrolase